MGEHGAHMLLAILAEHISKVNLEHPMLLYAKLNGNNRYAHRILLQRRPALGARSRSHG